jgi:sulfur-carrier protein
MLNIHYFASVREQVGRSGESLQLPEDVNTVGALADTLAMRGSQWTLLQDKQQVLIAVNQAVADRSHVLCGDEEVAFFPPMTGG